MPEESELLRAVLERPDEDAPRLAYAAWCHGQNDEPTKARAEFIRCQITLANVELGAERQPVYPLRYLSETLTHTYRGAWGQPLASLCDGYEFDRGFVELVRLSARHFLERAPRLFSLAPIRHLTLTDVRPDAAALFASPHLQGIRSLDLDRCELGDAQVGLLAASPHLAQLRWLSLAENRIGLPGAEALAQAKDLPSLAYANFYGNEVELNEKYSYDSGLVMDSFMPEAGLALERRRGRLRWLHHEATSIANAIPNRFRIRASG
jgi:uncharacterized protein (TIGR02996 family)